MKKRILVSVDAGETRVAVLESKGTGGAGGGGGSGRRGGGKSTGNRAASAGAAEDGARSGSGDWKVAELYVERRGQRSIVGNIYKGVVDNVLPGMEAAFVDIGLDRNGFLHVDEIVLPGGEAAPRRGRGKGRRIDELIKPRQEVLVQVVKDPLKTKGARLSMQLSIAGRYLVYMPQRRRGRRQPAALRRPSASASASCCRTSTQGEGGVIVRTAAQGARKADFERDIDYLRKLYEVVQRRADGGQGAGAWCSRRPTSRSACCATCSTKEFDGAIIDDAKQHHRVTSFFQRTAPELVDVGRALRRTASRCSSGWASRRRTARCSRAGSTCPRAAT